ncbi:hypothetical protein HYQ45_012360 [Verticillium longisporum]|uniref:Uncharacterized protein n=1 Tax=Verticillium longisporum TaxID=100787 RepID=A0A8I2ZFZ0_VERLO|nr:hypothetical protein HYQ45_012360 [Verticillium longisporum]
MRQRLLTSQPVQFSRRSLQVTLLAKTLAGNADTVTALGFGFWGVLRGLTALERPFASRLSVLRKNLPAY